MSHPQGSILKVPRWLDHRRPFETSSSSGVWQGSSSCISRELTKASDQLFNSVLWNSHSTTSKFSYIYQRFWEHPFHLVSEWFKVNSTNLQNCRHAQMHASCVHMCAYEVRLLLLHPEVTKLPKGNILMCIPPVTLQKWVVSLHSPCSNVILDMIKI